MPVAPHFLMLSSGGFTFDETTGLIRRFEDLRYYKPEGGTYRLERWLVTVGEYQSFAGVRVPTLGTVTWRLPEGDLEAMWRMTPTELR